MSIINSIQGLGGQLLGANKASSTDKMLSQNGMPGMDATNVDSLVGKFNLDKLQQATKGEMQGLGNGLGLSNDTGRSIFAEQTGTSDSPSFASMLTGLVDSVDAKSKVAEQASEDIMLGKSDNIHQAMISMQEASISFDLLVQVRNKLIDSYKELSRMQS